MLRTDLRNHRRSSEAELLEALERRDPLALAETCSRTLAVAFAVGRRLLPPSDVEALLLDVYSSLWEAPPTDVPLERWVRARCAELALSELRERRAAPATPSAHALAPDLPEPVTSYLDTTERALAALDEDDRVALLRAHDTGVPASEQDVGAGARVMRGLRALADPAAEDATRDGVDEDGRLADWVLGLLPVEEAAALERDVVGDPVRSARLQVLRRGRRRLEGLPPTPDLGPRVLAVVLSSGAAAAVQPPAALLADEEHAAGSPAGTAAPAADGGWAATEVGPDTAGDETAFDDTPPEGLPVAGSSPDDPQAEDRTDVAEETRDADFRLSDLFDDGDDGTIGSVLDDEADASPLWARQPAAAESDAAGAAHEDVGAARTPPRDAGEDLEDTGAWAPDPLAGDPVEDAGEPGTGDSGPEADEETWGPDGAAAWDDDGGATGASEVIDDEDLPRERSRSIGVRLLQVIGILLLLGAGVALGLFLGQILLTVLRG